jgi:zinc D-Ala-D-Ala carboxypeptidase
MNNLTAHFTLEEMTVSQTAARSEIDNTPSKREIEALRLLCVNVLEPLRISLGVPVIVSSGYRSPRLNRLVGGSANSQHMKGEAADIHVNSLSIQALFEAIRDSNLPYDQLIQEFDSWVHVSFSNRNRRQAIYAYHDKRGNVRFGTEKPG